MALLEIENLSVGFETRRGPLTAVDQMSFSVEVGETLGIVGESGCGKSITSLALMGLLPDNANFSADVMKFNGEDLLTVSDSRYREIRGGDIAMIFQDPMTSLNPSFTVGFQVQEALRIHGTCQKNELRDHSIELLKKVGIPEPASRLSSYPHQLSGGMCQRVMIAIAIACRPKLLIADEPTTALDVTIQAQILDLLAELQSETGMAMILITHDIGVVSEMTRKMIVMYAGQSVEAGSTHDIIAAPRHPYTEGLLNCLPSMHTDESKTRLPSIPGLVPDLVHRPKGCQLHPRCQYVEQRCKDEVPAVQLLKQRGVRCVKPLRSEGGRT